MSKKKLIGWGAVGALLVCLVWVAVAAISIGGEASSLDQLCKTSLAAKVPVAEVSAKIKAMGYSDSPSGAYSSIGPHHLAVIYETWLTVNVTKDANGAINSYHIDREGKLF